MPFTDKTWIFTVVAIWLSAIFAALIAFRTPGSPYAMRCASGFALAAPIIMIVCRVAMGRLWNKSSCIILGLLTALSFIGIAVNMAGYLDTPHASWQQPIFGLWSDSHYIYQIAEALYAGYPAEADIQTGYPRFIVLCFRLFGQGVLTPLLFNAAAMSLSAVVICHICTRLCNVKEKAFVSRISLLLFAVIPSIPYYGSVLFKEAFVILGFSLFTLMLADSYRGRLNARSIMCAAGGALLLVITRHSLCYFLIICALACFIHASSHHLGTRPARLNALLCILLLCAGCIKGGHELRGSRDFLLISDKYSNDAAGSMMNYDNLSRYNTIIGSYYEKTPIQKAALLPLTAAAQYFPPFPWNWTRDTDLARFIPYTHIAIPWYLVGGLILGYFILCTGRKRKAGDLSVWSCMWLICWLGVAYASGGTVARYTLFMLPLGIPLAVHTLYAVYTKIISRRQAVIYSLSYVTIMTAALCTAYFFLHP